MSIGPRIVVAITFQKVDDAPHAKTSAQSNDKSLQNIDGFIEKIHK